MDRLRRGGRTVSPCTYGVPVIDAPEEILAGLDPEQRRVATSFGGPVCVIAGAGTGKTRAITHRIAYGACTGRLDPRRTLAVTFTTRAAGTMRTRLEGMFTVCRPERSILPHCDRSSTSGLEPMAASCHR